MAHIQVTLRIDIKNGSKSVAWDGYTLNKDGEAKLPMLVTGVVQLICNAQCQAQNFELAQAQQMLEEVQAAIASLKYAEVKDEAPADA